VPPDSPAPPRVPADTALQRPVDTPPDVRAPAEHLNLIPSQTGGPADRVVRGDQDGTVEKRHLPRGQSGSREQVQSGHHVDAVAVLVDRVEPEADPMATRDGVHMRGT
jgi:hypothetical protein